MRVSQLRAFVTAVDSGSFSAAARALGFSQPTVSQQIKTLESDCQLQLFVRSGTGLELTPAGESILPWARQAVASFDGAEQAARDVRGIQGGAVAFGVMTNVDHYSLTEIAAHFHRDHPGVRLRLVGLNSYDVAQSVRRGILEAGVAVLPIPGEDLEVLPIARDEVLWISLDPQRVRRPMSVDRAVERPLILYDAHFGDLDPTRHQFAQRAQAAGVAIEPVIEVESVHSALRLAALGLGDTFAAQAVTESSPLDPKLYAGSFSPPMYDVLALVRRRGLPLSPAAEKLSAVVKALVGRWEGRSLDARPNAGRVI